MGRDGQAPLDTYGFISFFKDMDADRPPTMTGKATLFEGVPNLNPAREKIARAMLNTYYYTNETPRIVNEGAVVTLFLRDFFDNFIKAFLTTPLGRSVEENLKGSKKEKEEAFANYILYKFSGSDSSHMIGYPYSGDRKYPYIKEIHPLYQMFVELMSLEETLEETLPPEVEDFQGVVKQGEHPYSEKTHRVGELDPSIYYRAAPRPGRAPGGCGLGSCFSIRTRSPKKPRPPRGGGKKKRKRNKTIRKKIIKTTKRIKRTKRVKRTRRVKRNKRR